jgi:hypothetical protein
MATKKTYGTARKFTEGHLEVLGDQSEVSNPSPFDPINAKTKARYAEQRASNRKPWSVRKGNQIHGDDPNKSFKDRLAKWESDRANRGNSVHGLGHGPKPIDLGRDRGGNWYKESNYQMQGNSALRGAQGNTAENRVNQDIWRDGRDGSPLTKIDRLRDKRKDGMLTKREQRDQKLGQYSAQQPLARNELKEGIEGNFGTLGNFFNKDD